MESNENNKNKNDIIKNSNITLFINKSKTNKGDKNLLILSKLNLK